jgi:hypothetical protein
MKVSALAPVFIGLVSAAPATVVVREDVQEQSAVFRNELIDGDACPGSILIFARGTLELDNMVSFLLVLQPCCQLLERPQRGNTVIPGISRRSTPCRWSGGRLGCREYLDPGRWWPVRGQPRGQSCSRWLSFRSHRRDDWSARACEQQVPRCQDCHWRLQVCANSLPLPKKAKSFD